MEWNRDEEHRTYTAEQGRCRAVVWRADDGGWNAQVHHDGQVLWSEYFSHIEEAWAGCERHLHALAANGQC